MSGISKYFQKKKRDLSDQSNNGDDPKRLCEGSEIAVQIVMALQMIRFL